MYCYAHKQWDIDLEFQMCAFSSFRSMYIESEALFANKHLFDIHHLESNL